MSLIDSVLNLLGGTLFTRILGAAFLLFVSYWIYRLIVEPLWTATKGMWRFWRMRNRPMATLEITPPQHIDKAPLATEHLFGIIENLMGKYDIMPLEIDGTREDGIRYLIHTWPSNIAPLQRQIAAYLPDAKFNVLESAAPLEATTPHSHVLEIKQSRHYGYPLQSYEDLSTSDPASYISGAMAKLKPGERLTMQVVLTPHYSYWTNRLYNTIDAQGYAPLDRKVRAFILSRPVWIWIVTVIYALLANDALATFYVLAILLVVSLFLPKGEVTLTASQQQLFTGILDKLSKPLFRADIRLFVSAKSGKRVHELARGLLSSFAPLNTSGFQELYAPRRYSRPLGQKLSMFKLKHRVPSLLVFDSNILATSELASIYHFPYGTISTEGMVRSHSKSLPAPLAIKNGRFDVVVGRNNHHGETTDIGLTAKERERHMYIIGGTGNGKTTMLQYAIVQDILNGKGVAVVDPHGDLAEKLLRYIPEERIKDVVYFNPADLAHPVGINLLELPAGLSEDDLLLAQDFATEAIVSIFRKIFSDDDSGGHRIEHILRHAIHTAFTVEDANLFTIQKLLTNTAFRKQVVAKLEDEDLKDFWNEEFGKAGNYQKVKMMSGVTSKIGRFQRSVAARRILEQTKSTISFDDILNGKILICNLSKGLVGEDTSEMFGISILAKLQLAAYRRIHVKESERIPFYLYIDEFQNFATPLFMQMLSESRKYKLFLTMAEQSTSQQDERQMVETILANVGTVVAFRSGNPADEQFLLPLFQPYIKKGEIASLPSYNFYMKIMGVKPEEPFSGETIVLENDGDGATSNKVIEASRKNYAVKYKAPRPPKPTEPKKPNVKVEKKPKTKSSPKQNPRIPTKDRLKR